MADALRAVDGVAPAFQAALRLHLIETSPRLRAMQAERLPDAVWHEGLDTLPHLPLVLLANEFLDALPIRQFVGRGGVWMERFRGGMSVECPVPAQCRCPLLSLPQGEYE
jgi:SAM-dependent MidA family methyltransferase